MVIAALAEPALNEFGDTLTTFGCGYDNEIADEPVIEALAWLVATTIAEVTPCGTVAGAV